MVRVPNPTTLVPKTFHEMIFEYGSVEIGMLTAAPLHRISSRKVSSFGSERQLRLNLQASYRLDRKEITSKHRPVSTLTLYSSGTR